MLWERRDDTDFKYTPTKYSLTSKFLVMYFSSMTLVPVFLLRRNYVADSNMHVCLCIQGVFEFCTTGGMSTTGGRSQILEI